jgi:hypothetical protein
VDEIICWLTGHTAASLAAVVADRTSFADFIAHARR